MGHSLSPGDLLTLLREWHGGIVVSTKPVGSPSLHVLLVPVQVSSGCSSFPPQ